MRLTEALLAAGIGAAAAGAMSGGGPFTGHMGEVLHIVRGAVEGAETVRSGGIGVVPDPLWKTPPQPEDPARDG